jgi:hypothetical protein
VAIRGVGSRMKAQEMRYFVAGNIWLFASLAVFLLRQTERTSPHRVSLLGIGTWFSPGAYNVVALLILLIACVFFLVGWKQDRRD